MSVPDQDEFDMNNLLRRNWRNEILTDLLHQADTLAEKIVKRGLKDGGRMNFGK